MLRRNNRVLRVCQCVWRGRRWMGETPKAPNKVPTSAPRPLGRPGPVSEQGQAPVAIRRLEKEEHLQMVQNLPLQREPLFRPSAMPYWERTLYPVLRLVGGYSKMAQVERNADAQWRSVEEQATVDAWFENLGIRRTFMTEQALLNLHVWLLHKRFTLEWWGKGVLNGRLADKALFDRLWSDTMKRIRNAGVREMSVNKQLELVQKAAFMDMFEYDLALKQEDDNMELAGALFRGVFLGDDAADVADVIRLADWVRDEVANIMTQPAEDVYRGWITWSPALGETRDDRLERQKQMFQGEWREMLFVDGKLFFYNTKTMQVSKGPEPPKGLYGRRRFALAHHLARLEAQDLLPAGTANPNKLVSFAADEANEKAIQAFQETNSEDDDPRFRVVVPKRP